MSTSWIHTIQVVPSKHFYTIFWSFWSGRFRITWKLCRNVSSLMITVTTKYLYWKVRVFHEGVREPRHFQWDSIIWAHVTIYSSFILTRAEQKTFIYSICMHQATLGQGVYDFVHLDSFIFPFKTDGHYNICSWFTHHYQYMWNIFFKDLSRNSGTTFSKI